MAARLRQTVAAGARFRLRQHTPASTIGPEPSPAAVPLDPTRLTAGPLDSARLPAGPLDPTAAP